MLSLVLTVLQCIGALALFVYGMKTMSEGIQKLAGKNIRGVLNKLTNNRLKSITTGIITTSLVQSSSAISVLVVGFINAGIITLRQAMGLIMGANIGTTSTAILVTAFGFLDFSIDTLALPIVAIGLPLFFARKDWHRSLAEFVVGFGLLLLSIEFLRNSIPAIDKDSISFLESFSEGQFLSSLIFVITGVVLTILFQSSSATMALVLVLCEQEVITLQAAAIVIVGANIGTTLTANIAAIVANVHGKRLARFHSLFNIVGALWFLPFMSIAISLIENAFTSLGFTQEMDFNLAKWALVSVHVAFNIANTLLFIPITPSVENLLKRLVPSKENDQQEFKLEYIETGVMKTPELALLEANKEIVRLAQRSSENCQRLIRLLESNDRSLQEEILAQLRKHEADTDRAEEEVTRYLSRLTEDVISNSTSIKVSRLLSIVNDIEIIGDLYFQITKIFDRKISKEIYFLPEQRDGIKSMLNTLHESGRVMVTQLKSEEDRTTDLEHAYRLESLINKKRNQLRKMHLKGIETGDFNIKSAMVFSELYTSIERIGDHNLKICEAHSGIL